MAYIYNRFEITEALRSDFIRPVPILVLIKDRLNIKNNGHKSCKPLLCLVPKGGLEPPPVVTLTGF